MIGSDEDVDDDDANIEESGDDDDDEFLVPSTRKKRKTPSKKSGQKKHKGRGRNKRSKLDQTEECLLGEANCRFIDGKHEEAIDLMYDLIKEKPMAHEPYNDLGEMFEQMNEVEKALQYYFLAAHLCPNDGDYWQTTAEKHLEHQQYEIAIKCYTKAIKFIQDEEKRMNCRFERSAIHELLYYSSDPNIDLKTKASHLKEAIAGYEEIIRVLDPSRDHSIYIEQIPKVAKLYYENEDLVSAIRLLDESFEKFESLVEINNVNMYLELLLCHGAFNKALVIFHKYCGVIFTLTKNEVFPVNHILSPDFIAQNHLQLQAGLTCELQIDLRAKLVVCLVSLNCLYSVREIQSVLLEKCSPEEAGDLFFAIGKSYMDRSMHTDAEPFLKKAVESESFGSDPEYWLRLARCLRQLSKDEESITAYRNVIALSPNEIDPRLEVSQLLIKHNRSDEAVEVATQPLDQDEESHSFPHPSSSSSHPSSLPPLDPASDSSDVAKINLDLLLVRVQLLYQRKNFLEFARVARIFLLSDMVYLNDTKEMDCMISSSCTRTRIDSLKGIRKDLSKEITLQRDRYSGRLPSSDALFDVWIKLCQVLLFELQNVLELERIVFSAFTCSSFSGRERQLEFISLMCLYKSRRSENNVLYSLIRAVILRVSSNLTKFYSKF